MLVRQLADVFNNTAMEGAKGITTQMAFCNSKNINIMDNTVGSLTKFERQIIIGSLLGDGYMRIIPGRFNAFLEINHSIKAKEYVDYKFQSLKRLCRSAPKERTTN